MDIALTQDHMNVLNSTLIDQDRIKAGVFTESEQRLLKIVDRVQAFMKERYPEETFTIKGLKDIFFESPTLTFRVLTTVGEEYSVFAHYQQTDLSDLTLTESYFAQAKTPELVELIEQRLAEQGISGAKLSVWMYGSFTAATDPRKPLEELLADGLTVGVSGQIFLSAQDGAVTEEQLRTAFSGMGVTGWLSCYVMEALPEGDARAEWVKEYCKPLGIAAIELKLEQ